MTDTLPIQELTNLVRPQLDRLNRELLTDLAPGHREMLPLIEHVGGYRGKQLRPMLTFLSGIACRGATHSSGSPAALDTPRWQHCARIRQPPKQPARWRREPRTLRHAPSA